MGSMHELYLKKTAERRLSRGHPWVYSNEIDVDRSPLKGLTPGIEVAVLTASGNRLGSGYVSPGSLVSVRLLARGSEELTGLLQSRIARALAFRERTFAEPYYRLVFAEGDDLPGLVIDRYGDELVVQVSTWGMENRRTEIVQILESLLAPRAIYFDDSSTVRKLEGLAGPTTDAERPALLREMGLARMVSTSNCPAVRRKPAGITISATIEPKPFVGFQAKGCWIFSVTLAAGVFSLRTRERRRCCASIAQLLRSKQPAQLREARGLRLKPSKPRLKPFLRRLRGRNGDGIWWCLTRPR